MNQLRLVGSTKENNMYKRKVIRGLRNPMKALTHILLVLNGLRYKLEYKIMNGKNIQIGSGLKVRKRLSIKGQGRVFLGDNIMIDGTSHTVTPWTCSRDAVISIGNNVFLNGTRFSCIKRIEIGHDCILADCRILDTDFHSILPDKRNDPKEIRSAPIKIGNNVWISLGCVVLQGVTIGDNSTIAAGSVVTGDIPEYTVYGGNPATFIRDVPRGTEGKTA